LTLHPASPDSPALEQVLSCRSVPPIHPFTFLSSRQSIHPLTHPTHHPGITPHRSHLSPLLFLAGRRSIGPLHSPVSLSLSLSLPSFGHLRISPPFDHGPKEHAPTGNLRMHRYGHCLDSTPDAAMPAIQQPISLPSYIRSPCSSSLGCKCNRTLGSKHFSYRSKCGGRKVPR